MVKHHTCNANLMRNGADFSVYINTGQVSCSMLFRTIHYEVNHESWTSLFNGIMSIFDVSLGIVGSRNSMEVTQELVRMKLSVGVKLRWMLSLSRFVLMLLWSFLLL